VKKNLVASHIQKMGEALKYRGLVMLEYGSCVRPVFGQDDGHLKL